MDVRFLPSPRRRFLSIVACYLLVALVAYGRVLPSFFLADDFAFLDAVRGGGHWWWPRDLAGQLFRPATILLFRIEYAAWGLRPFGFHFTNLALHTANAFLVFGIASQLIRQTDRQQSRFWLGCYFLYLPAMLRPSVGSPGRLT